MKLIIFSVLIVFLIGLVSLVSADTCNYSYCVKDELHVCDDSDDRIKCNEKGG